MKQNPSVLGIDLAKRVFHLVGMDDAGHIVLRKRLTRDALMPFIAHLSPVVIGMEACGGAHYWARRFREHGHEMRLIAPQFVRPYVKSNKNDPADAQAICEAVTRPTMRFVPIKGVGQQDLQSFHRARERVVKARTALVNEIRGLLGEYGIVLPQSVTKFRHSFMSTLEAERAKLTMLSQELFAQLYEEFCALEKRLAYYTEKLEALGAAHPVCQRLLTIPGIGPLTPQPLSLPSAVRPASPDSGVGQVFKGRGVDQEGERRLHQGPQDTGDLLHEAGYMAASVPRRRTHDFSLTSAAGPYMANSIRLFIAQ